MKATTKNGLNALLIVNYVDGLIKSLCGRWLGRPGQLGSGNQPGGHLHILCALGEVAEGGSQEGRGATEGVMVTVDWEVKQHRLTDETR